MTYHSQSTEWTPSCPFGLKQSLFPALFLVLSCIIPYYYSYNPYPPPYNPMPPGYTDRLFLFLIGDYDYFLRIRLLSVSIPFWILTVLIIVQMFTPRLKTYQKDLILHVCIGSMLIILWWFLGYWMFSLTDYDLFWIKIPVIITPMLGIAFVSIHRAINWKL